MQFWFLHAVGASCLVVPLARRLPKGRLGGCGSNSVNFGCLEERNYSKVGGEGSEDSLTSSLAVFVFCQVALLSLSFHHLAHSVLLVTHCYAPVHCFIVVSLLIVCSVLFCKLVQCISRGTDRDATCITTCMCTRPCMRHHATTQ
jgi:hypothetical protein